MEKGPLSLLTLACPRSKPPLTANTTAWRVQGCAPTPRSGLYLFTIMIAGRISAGLFLTKSLRSPPRLITAVTNLNTRSSEQTQKVTSAKQAPFQALQRQNSHSCCENAWKISAPRPEAHRFKCLTSISPEMLSSAKRHHILYPINPVHGADLCKTIKTSSRCSGWSLQYEIAILGYLGYYLIYWGVLFC